MLIIEVYKLYGCWSDISRKLNFGATTYRNWLNRGYIPIRTQELIEFRTQGRLKASLDHLTPQEGLERFKKTSAISY